MSRTDEFQYDSTHHPSDDQLINYLDGKLPEAAHENLQAHLVECENCLDMFKDVRDFFEAHRADEQILTQGRFTAWTALWRRIREEDNQNVYRANFVPKWRMNTLTAVTMAAAVLVVLALGIWIIRQRRNEQQLSVQLQQARQQNAELQANQEKLAARTKELEEQNLQLQQRARADQSDTPESVATRRPELNPPIYDLYARNFTQRSGNQGEINQIKVPPSANSIILILNGEGVAPSSSYGVEIVNSVGKLIWRGRGLRKGQLGNLTLTIDRSFLKAATYRLNLYRQEDWSAKALAEYVIRIE